MPSAELSVLTGPALSTAVTSVDNTGLFPAAVATGSADIPSKEPGPEVGTAEQAEPNSAVMAESAVAMGDSDMASLDMASLDTVDPLSDEQAVKGQTAGCDHQGGATTRDRLFRG